MKFLVDAQLPPRLAAWIAGREHEAIHVATFQGGLRLPDDAIWQQAARDGWIIVTKDKDFLDLAAVHGMPPVVLYIGIGNASTTTLIELLADAWTSTAAELARPDAGVVMLERGRLVVLRRA